MPFPTRYGNKRKTKRHKSSSTPLLRSASISGVTNIARAADKAGSGFLRWMTTDHAHTNTFLMLIDKPRSGFWAWIVYWIKCLLTAIGVALVRTLLIIVLYIIWIPIMLWLINYIITH